MRLGEIEALKRTQIRVGSIFKMVFYPTDNVKPKGENAKSRMKYFVIAGIDGEGNYIGVSLINTNVNIHFAPIIAPYQLCIYPEKYDFLECKFRYVDCYALRSISKSRILSDAEYIGYLTEDDIKQVRYLLRKSPIMDARTISQYGLED